MDQRSFEIINADCLGALKELAEDSADALVTDPPAGISFMQKKWDDDKGSPEKWRSWLAEVMKEALRVLKPGAHGLVWSIPRTSHWTGMALERAGFDIRDAIVHHFGSGFPKNHNLKEVLDGFGTALKPSSEIWWLIRKPFKGSIASNVLKHGTGGINVDGCRIGDDNTITKHSKDMGYHGGLKLAGEIYFTGSDKGRWPTNTLFTHSAQCSADECVVGCPVLEIGEQSGESFGGGAVKDHNRSTIRGFASKRALPFSGFDDSGTAARFFPRFRYQAKPSQAEKEAGLSALPLRRSNKLNEGGMQARRDAKADKAIESQGLDAKGRTLIREDGSKTLVDRFIPQSRVNNHPTVKPIELMRWLCRLITPPGGRVLDPFMGSGTTGCAAILEGFKFIGIEQNLEYCEIAKHRIEWWQIKSACQISKHEELDSEGKPKQMGLFA